jgi:ribonuclease HI
VLVSPTNLGLWFQEALVNAPASIVRRPIREPDCGPLSSGRCLLPARCRANPSLDDLILEGRNLRECLVIYVDAALDKNGRAGCGLAVFVRGRAVYTESFGFSHLGGSAQLEAHVCAGALDLAAARWPHHRVIVRTDCAPVVRSRMPSSDSFRIAVFEVRERCRRGWRVVRYVSRKANPAHELAREGLKSLSRQPALAAA